MLLKVSAVVQASEVVAESPLYQLQEKLAGLDEIFEFVALRGPLLLDASPLQPVEVALLFGLVPKLAQLPTPFALFAVCPNPVALATS